MRTQFQKPSPDCKIAITFVTNSYVIGHEGPVSTQLTGAVIRDTKHTAPNSVRLVLDSPGPVPIREISMHTVTALEYMDGRPAATLAVDSQIRTWLVNGSKGIKYTVIKNKSSWTCTCPGFQFRKSCRHIQESLDA